MSLVWSPDGPQKIARISQKWPESARISPNWPDLVQSCSLCGASNIAGAMMSAPEQQTMEPRLEADRCLGFFFCAVARIGHFRV